MKLTNKQIAIICNAVEIYKDDLENRIIKIKETKDFYKYLENEIASSNTIINTTRYTYTNDIDLTESQIHTIKEALWIEMQRLEYSITIQTDYFLDTIYGKEVQRQYRSVMKLYNLLKGDEK